MEELTNDPSPRPQVGSQELAGVLARDDVRGESSDSATIDQLVGGIIRSVLATGRVWPGAWLLADRTQYPAVKSIAHPIVIDAEKLPEWMRKRGFKGGVIKMKTGEPLYSDDNFHGSMVTVSLRAAAGRLAIVDLSCWISTPARGGYDLRGYRQEALTFWRARDRSWRLAPLAPPRD